MTRPGFTKVRRSAFAAVSAALLMAASAGSAELTSEHTGHFEGRLASGALWSIDVPRNWNGTLLLWSHGYRADMATAAPEDAPKGTKDELLREGYALAASSYSTGGWALDQAVPDQVATIDTFAETVGRPKRVIAWGQSMGGLVTVALAERHPERFSAALPMCGSVGGAVGMMNEALDGAFAFKTLLDKDGAVQLVNVGDDRQNGARVQAILAEAQQTPQGRARIGLASVLAGLPGWTDPKAPEPAADDFAGQEQEAAKSFAMGVFLPRSDQERRSGGVFSWNSGVDYAQELERSGRKPYVEALYRAAGLNLADDLAALNRAPRVEGSARAVAYMKANYTPSGRIRIPVLSVHTIGDGLTSVTLERAYAEAVSSAGRADLLRDAFVRGAGHCAFRPGESVAALRALESRVDTGRWNTSPEALNAAAAGLAREPARFVSYSPLPFLRPCTTATRFCKGEPTS